MKISARLCVLWTATCFYLLCSCVQLVVAKTQSSDHKSKLAKDGKASRQSKPKVPSDRPHIIFIMADDAGWNDFSFHGSAQIPTPNIDALALTGTILNRYYVSPLCTPTRAAVMTGKHPIHLGLQHYVIRGASSGGLPLKEKLLPAYLKELGYATHLIGKWHLGHSKTEYLPTKRGFDSHYGYWLGKGDYFSHIAVDGKDPTGGKSWGYDFKRDTQADRNVYGSYITKVLTNEAVSIINTHKKDKPLFLMFNHMAPHSAHSYSPLQAPKDNIAKFLNTTVSNPSRRLYAAMVDTVDVSLGEVVGALSKKNMLANSIVVFASDNGGAPDGYDSNYGSNWPLRGVKNTLWEGGTRVSAFIWSPLVMNRVSSDLMHAIDWVPTLFEAAGGNPLTLHGLDGLSMWKTLTEGVESPRVTMLYNIDGPYNNSAVRDGPWKLLQGSSPTNDLGKGDWNGWHGESGQESGSNNQLLQVIIESGVAKALVKIGYELDLEIMREQQRDAQVFCNRQRDDTPPCDLDKAPCLFHVEDDPCELWNVADKEADKVKQLLALIQEFNKTYITPFSRELNSSGFPKHWGNEWVTWETNLVDLLAKSNKNCGKPRTTKSNTQSAHVFQPGLLVSMLYLCYKWTISVTTT